MADTKKYKINRVVDAQGTLEVVHPETEAGQVLYSGTIGETAVENVDEALGALKTLAENSGVTSVNGQKGDVTITKSSVGLGNVDNTSDLAKPVSTAQQTAIDNAKGEAVSSANSYTDSKVADYIPASQKGANGGVATLDTTGKVPTSQLPSYVDDVVEYATRLSFPTVGEAGKIYVAQDSNLTYRWSGSDYVIISPTIALGETSSTAYAGDKGKANADAIAGLQTAVTNITNGTTVVPNATNAAQLGGVSADQYAQLSDIPEDKLFIIKGTSLYVDHSGFPVTIDKTYEQILTAIQDGKVPVLRVTATDDNKDYYYYYTGFIHTDIVFYRQTLYDMYCYSVEVDSTVSNSHTSYAHNVSDTSSGAIISKIAMAYSGGVIDVTRRAMQNSDLPDSGVTSGAYSAVQVNAKGVVTAGGTSIEWGASGQTAPSENLMVGGLFFELVE